MTTLNIAVWRDAAIEAEHRLEWGRAADLWQMAIDNYPFCPSHMTRLDIARMEARKDACLKMYFPS